MCVEREEKLEMDKVHGYVEKEGKSESLWGVEKENLSDGGLEIGKGIIKERW